RIPYRQFVTPWIVDNITKVVAKPIGGMQPGWQAPMLSRPRNCHARMPAFRSVGARLLPQSKRMGRAPATPILTPQDIRFHESQSLLPAALRTSLACYQPGCRESHLWPDGTCGAAGFRSRGSRQARYRRTDRLAE